METGSAMTSERSDLHLETQTGCHWAILMDWYSEMRMGSHLVIRSD